MEFTITTLYSLSFVTTSDYDTNLQTLLGLLKETPQDSIVVAHEVSLTGFDYDNLEAATAFAQNAIRELKKSSINRTVILTMLERREGEVYNFAKIFHNGEVVYERAKARLFRFGDEHKFMSEGSDSEFKIVEVGGVKIALLICFELRFKELWKMAEGADIIAVPSWWGVLRTEHFKALTQT
ncbi:MAG: carbon-nitrogen hydrolase family protein, partial [Campylobacterota bacterium]|nr:carbon-nitrogen hydrolase family protein [Campylobacterota bacterium]